MVYFNLQVEQEHSGHSSVSHYGLYRPDIHNYGHGLRYWNRGDVEQPRTIKV